MISACRQGPASAHVDEVADEVANEDVLRLRRSGEAFSVLSTI
jgi:acylphosphatase